MLYNSIAIKRQGFSTIDGRCFSPMTAAMRRARTLSERTKDAVVYCNSSDRGMRLVQSFTFVNGRLTGMTVRYCGKVVTKDETIPEELWEKFNEKR